MVRLQVELTANLEENSAALMTSDRGSSGVAELTLTTPVTPKTAGLNPNATVFLSNKSSTAQQPDNSQWDGENANNEYQLANGDISKAELGGAETPAESPLSSDVSSGYLDNQVPTTTATFSTDNSVVDVEESVVNSNASVTSVTEDQLRQLLKEQLENCFSRENLASDRYLQSQMDGDQYVPIATVANLQQIQQLTTDLDLITELLKELPNVQVHNVEGKGEKVRPNHNRCIVILREIPESTPLEDVKNLFSGENCPRFVSCEFAANDSWYVTFDSDASAQQAYQYLREDVCSFLGKPILARIKAKPLIRMTYPRNGYRPQYHQQQAAQQQQQQQTVGVTSPPVVSQADQVVTQQPAQPAQQQTQYQVQQQVPIMTQYINGQQTLPFFPNAALLPSWPTNVNVTSPTLLDPSMVLAINGYQATSVKINPGPSRNPYPNVNRNSRNPRPLRLGPEHRMHSDGRPNQDRPLGPGGGALDRRGDNSGGSGVTHRTSPRNTDSSQISGHHSPFHRDGRRGDNPNVNHSHMAHSAVQPQPPPPPPPPPPQAPVLDTNSNIAIGNRQLDSLSQRPRGYRSRRRRDDDGARSMRPTSSMAATKDSKLPNEPQFDLEINSFPPLPGPGTANSSTAGDIFESKLSDVVKGTAKPQVRETKASPPPVPPPPPAPSASIQSPPATTVTSPITTTTPVPAATRPSTPPKSHESTPMAVASNGANTSTVPSGGSTCSCTASAVTATRVPSPPIVPQKSAKTSCLPESQPKSAESHISQRQANSAPNKTVDKPAPVQQQTQVKLTYAQMLARGREAEAAAAEGGSKPRSSDESGEDDSKPTRASQTLKEQSQTIKTSTANSRPMVKDQGRREYEPKDQRFGAGRRSKENRERRDRRRSERDGSRSSTK